MCDKRRFIIGSYELILMMRFSSSSRCLCIEFFANTDVRSRPPPVEPHHFSEADFNDYSDGERVGDIDIHTDDPGSRYVGEAAPSASPRISDELPTSGSRITTSRPTSGHVWMLSIPK